jgi:hypothetical protein
VPSQARSIRGGAGPERRSAGSGIAHAWSTLDRERRLAAVAAVALFATMFLPWYQQNAVVSARKVAPLVSSNLNAFQVFSFVEAAVLLVAVAVLFLLYARAEGREFKLPGGDGTVVLAAGLWSALLLVLRLFDKPGVTQHGVAANVGVQWGIFFALAAAGLLAYAGSRMRAGQRPEPPLMRRGGAPRRPREPVGREWEHSADPKRPAAVREDEETVVISRATPAPTPPRRTPAPAKPRGPGQAGTSSSREEQLSFEDPPDLPLR